MITLISIVGLIIYHSTSNYNREMIMQFFIIIMTSRMILVIEAIIPIYYNNIIHFIDTGN